MLLNCYSTLTYIAFFVSFYFARRQQLLANFQMLMYFRAFVPLSIMSSSGILVALFCPRFIVAHSFCVAFLSIRGQSLCSERALFRAKVFPLLPRGHGPEISPAKTATD